MGLLRSKSSTEEKPAPVWFVVERETFGAMAFSRTTREAAIEDFAAHLAQAVENGEGYSPFQRRRRLAVIGPNIHTRADGDDAVRYVPEFDDIEDPLLIGDAALRAVLSPEEYALIVQKPVASVFLES